MVDYSDDEELHVYEHFCTYLADHGFKLKLNILDNKASKAVKGRSSKLEESTNLVEP